MRRCAGLSAPLLFACNTRRGPNGVHSYICNSRKSAHARTTLFLSSRKIFAAGDKPIRNIAFNFNNSKGQLSKNNLRRIAIIFLSISLNICFEYPQHMFRLRNKKIIFSYALLSGGPVI